MTTKERPIIFSGPMVLANLEGRKTQTRRVIKWQSDMEFDPADPHYGPYWLPYATEAKGEDARVRCPYGKPGDRLWVRETWRVCGGCEYEYLHEQSEVMYRSTHEKDRFPLTWESYKWRPSIFMPRWASRITLEITDVRVERLQEINDADAIAEGIAELSLQDGEPGAWWSAAPDRRLHSRTPRGAFVRLWRSIHGEGSWHANPWVWVIEYRRLEAE